MEEFYLFFEYVQLLSNRFSFIVWKDFENNN